MPEVFVAVLFLFLPVLIIYLCHKVPFLNERSTIIIAYALGLVLGNTGLLPHGSSTVQEGISSLSILFAIPLLLFSLNIKEWIKIAGTSFLSMIYGIVSVALAVLAGHIFFEDKIPELWKISGMLVGIYTGGTVNLAAIKTALGVSSTTYILVNTYDLILSSAYLFFIVGFGQKFFLLFLKPFKNTDTKTDVESNEFENIEMYFQIFNRKNFFSSIKILGVAALIFAVGILFYFISPPDMATLIVILNVTGLGLLASFIPAVNRNRHSYHIGMYFILIFSLVVASMADFNQFFGKNLYLFYYVGFVIVAAVVFHLILSKIFKVDADTFIISSIALSFSPPFVPLVAGSLKNRQLIVSGLTIGIIGYAIGNYLGIFMAYLLR